MKSIKQMQLEENERRRKEDERRKSFANKLKQLEAKEAARIWRIAKSVDLTDHTVNDEHLAAGFRRAIELAGQDGTDPAASSGAGSHGE